MTYQEERIVQVLDYFARRLPGRQFSKLNALKLVYLADRYHLRKYATPILWDTYYAMPYGPVASNTKRLIERICTDPSLTDYISVSEDASGIMRISSRKPPNNDQLRNSEGEALNAALHQWTLHDNLVAFTHQFPEWKSAEKRLEKGAKSVKMSYQDFFKPCAIEGCEYCEIPPDVLAMNLSVFKEEASFRRVSA